MKKIIVLSILIICCFGVSLSISEVTYKEPEALINNSIYQKDFVSFTNGEINKFSTKDNPKAKGINITVSYPKNWKIGEGNHPNIVKKFESSSSDGVTRMFVILIKDIPDEILKIGNEEDIANELFSEERLKNGELYGFSTFIKGGRNKYDDQLGAYIIGASVSEYMGLKVNQYFLSHMFLYKNKMILIQCGVAGAGQAKDIEKEFNNYLPLFMLIGNSVILEDKWVYSNNIKTTATIKPIAFIISLLLILLVILLPVFIIRYFISRYRKVAPINDRSLNNNIENNKKPNNTLRDMLGVVFVIFFAFIVGLLKDYNIHIGFIGYFIFFFILYKITGWNLGFAKENNSIIDSKINNIKKDKKDT